MTQVSSKEINKVFYTTPRDGYMKDNLWIKRKEEEYLNSILDDLGVSVCIDGPTGTGKSSLAITMLKKKKLNHILIQVTKNMTWKDFCRRLLNGKVNNSNNAINIGVDIGVEKGLPLFKIHWGLNSTDNSLEDLELEDKIINRMTDVNICEFLYSKQVSLLIDDFERASDEILSNIGEMCKLLTESFISEKSKLIIVGTDDIYRRLTKFNISLEGRLKELSIGTVDNKTDSWKFLNDGFSKLNLRHPTQEYFNRTKGVTKEDVTECSLACYDAADGLLKSLNELGKEIVKNASVNQRISKATIINVSKKYLENNIRKFNQDFPIFTTLLKRNTFAKMIAIYFYENGIGKIHNWEEIYNKINVKVDEAQIENAICELVDINFLTRTGYNGETLFVTNPTFAHTVGVILSKTERYEIPKAFISENGQLVLPLFKK